MKFILTMFALVILVACGGGRDSSTLPTKPTLEPLPTFTFPPSSGTSQRTQQSQTANDSLTLTASVKELAVESIKGYPEVLDAAIKQDGRKLSLVVVVGCATSDAVAKDMGDNFVRMVKSFGPEPAPTKEIGKGDFDYLVGVYCGNDTQIALGAKVRNSTRITW